MTNQICNRCQKLIETPAYVIVSPAIVLQEMFDKTPPLFNCPEHAENFTKQMLFHDFCWIAELKDHGVEIHDLEEVKKKYAKEALDKIINESSSKSLNKEEI